MKKSQITTRLLLTAVLLLVGLETVATPQGGRSIPFETFQGLHHSGGGIHEDRGLVVLKKAEWQAVWNLLNPGEAAPALPDVDFSRNSLIVAFRGGTKPWAFAIKEVRKRASTLTIITEQVLNNRLCAYPPYVPVPYHIVIIPKISKKLQRNAVFEVISVIDSNCSPIG